MSKGPEFQRLADHLRVLANPNRLELLYELRSPKRVDELELTPERVAEGENPDRPISHQAVRKHLDKLASIDVVATEARNRDGHLVDEHVLNHQRLFAIVEEFRSLGELEPDRTVREEETIPDERSAEADTDEGPRLVVVRGPREGQTYPLSDADRDPERGWVIGRETSLPVALDYDPFVSAENSVIERTKDGFQLRDLPESRNGTLLNFEQLSPGQRAQLDEGDVIGVGRTNLVFRS